MADVNATLSAAWGSAYVNDFIDKGRVKRVYMQADAPFRMVPEDLDKWYVRNAQGDMVPFSMFAQGSWTFGSPRLERFNGAPAVQIQGQAAPGSSSGEAMAAMETARRAAAVRASASRGPACPTRSGCRARRRRCSTACRCWSCSCASPRCTRAGRFRSRCC